MAGKRTRKQQPTVDYVALLEAMYQANKNLSWDSFFENADDLYESGSNEWYREVIGEAQDAGAQ